MARNSRSLVIFLVGLAANAELRAGGVEDLAAFDFGLRFPAALARFSSYADVAGVGGASAGSRYSTSTNPAATDWMRSAEQPHSVSPQLSRIRFRNGPTLAVSALAGGVSTAALGSFQPAIARIDNDGSLDSGVPLISGDYAQMQWGKKLNDVLAAGANVNYSKFATRVGAGGMTVVDSTSDGVGVRAGLLWAASKKLNLGIVFDASRSRGRGSFLDMTCFCSVEMNDKSRSVSLRPGLAYEYAEQSSIYVDYLHGRFHNNTGSLTSKVLSLGIEHQFAAGFFARLGYARDARGLSAKTAGIGLSPSKTISIDLAWQRDMFPELQPEFGRSSLVNLSFSMAF